VGSVLSLIRKLLGLNSADQGLERYVLNQVVNLPKLNTGTLNSTSHQLEPDNSLKQTVHQTDLLDKVFVWVDGDLSWQAITGSHQRVS